MIQSFFDGLSESSVLTALKANPIQGVKLLTYHDGGNDSWKTETAEGEAAIVDVLNIHDVEKNRSEKPDINPQKKKLLPADGLQFLCGMPSIMYAEPIKLVFNHKNQLQCVTADTCHHQVLFPVQERYVDTELFSESMTSDIFDSPNFGRVWFVLFGPNPDSWPDQVSKERWDYLLLLLNKHLNHVKS